MVDLQSNKKRKGKKNFYNKPVNIMGHCKHNDNEFVERSTSLKGYKNKLKESE